MDKLEPTGVLLAKNRTRATQVRSVAKALRIVDLLVEAGRELSLADIAQGLKLPKSTTHGLISTLREFGYIEQSPENGKYRLGIRLFEIGSVVARSWDVRAVAVPYIEKLVSELQETVHLAVLDRGEVLYIDKRESYRPFCMVTEIGTRLPAHCTGLGKVLLAHLNPAELRRIIAEKGLKRYTPNTITDVGRLEEELERVHQRGYAIDNEELMEGLRCVAAPIYDREGKAVAAMSISGPAARLTGERLRRAIVLVTDTSSQVSRALGYRGS